MSIFKIHPLDLELNKPIGLKLPYSQDNKYFFGVNYLTIDQIKSNILNLLLTDKKFKN